jgi:Subtilase family/FlgD Ig-like domain
VTRTVLLGTCLVVLFAASAEAGLRSRALPVPESRVEPRLAARAEATPADRIHAIVRVPSSGRREAENGGIRLLRSLRGDLWLASVPSAATARRALPDGVVAAWDLLPVDRRDAAFASRLAALPPDEPVALRVKTFADASNDAVIAAVAAAGGAVRDVYARLGIVEVVVPAASLDGLASLDVVRWIEDAPPAGIDQNNGMRFDAHVDAVHAAGYDGTGVTIGAWESGIPDSTHPDFAGRTGVGEGGLSVTAHGTHTAGILIGDGTNSQAEGGNPLQWRGVASGATLVSWNLTGMIAEVDTAINTYGVDISNNSWVYNVNTLNCELYGDYGTDAPELDAIVRGLYGRTVPIVFAAGNERDDGDCSIVANGGYRTIPPPATAKNVISVGAHYSDVMYMTAFSSWGPTDDGRMKPDVSAPGCDQFGDTAITSTAIGGGYGGMCGTSMAAAVVSGATGLLFETWRGIYAGDPRPATAKVLLGGFAQDRAGPGPDYRFGLGAIDVEASVEALRTATTVEGEVDDAGTREWVFTVPPGTPQLLVTLAWDDPPGAELADSALVNDLDLQLIDPSLGTHLPFVLDPADPSADATIGVNRLDNVEQVRVDTPAAGTWTARILGTNVPVEPQTYSLVGFDTRPPADPASLEAAAVDDTTAAVTWIRAGDSDRAGTLVVRSDAPIAWTPSDGAAYAPGAEPASGVFVIASDDVDHASTALVDDALAPGVTYHYALFSYDEVPNYAPGVTDTATTGTDAVDVPAVVAAGRVELRLTGAHPARDAVTMRLELPATTYVEIAVHDVAGRRVATVLHGERAAGSHAIAWDGRTSGGQRAAGGIYFVRLRAGASTFTRKVVLVR